MLSNQLQIPNQFYTPKSPLQNVVMSDDLQSNFPFFLFLFVLKCILDSLMSLLYSLSTVNGPVWESLSGICIDFLLTW